MVKELLINGNSKMGKRSVVWNFNLPPIKTCTPTKWCTEYTGKQPNCYALKGNFIFANVKKGTLERLEASKQEDFVKRMVKEIGKKQPQYFRWHVSGDFYSEDYARKVMEIVRTFPDILFRTTTRRRDLTKVLQELNAFPNMIVRESLDSERTTPVMGLPFAALSDLDIVSVSGSESYACKNDCPECGYYCWENPGNMHFVKH